VGDKMDLKTFGSILKQARVQKKLTADQLAEELNISSKSIWQIEGGKRATSLPVLINLCNVLDVSPAHLLSADLNPDLSPFGNDELLEVILSLDKVEKELLLDFAKVLLTNHEKYRNL